MPKASHFQLVADNTVLNDHIANEEIATGIGMFFGLFYMMNMHYPEKCSAFLEFLQRCGNYNSLTIIICRVFKKWWEGAEGVPLVLWARLKSAVNFKLE